MNTDKRKKLIGVDPEFMELTGRMFSAVSELVEDMENFYPSFKTEWSKSHEPFPCDIATDMEELKAILEELHRLAERTMAEKMFSHVGAEA
tara:strand:+ start:416 stop:688 length:273 start_codon:yes stop_codon:yes gene_type:complete